MHTRTITGQCRGRDLRLLLVAIALIASLNQSSHAASAAPALPPLVKRLQVPLLLNCLTNSGTPTQRLALAEHHLCGYRLTASGVPVPEGPGVPISSNCGTLQLGIYNNGNYSAVWLFDVYDTFLLMVGVTYSGYWYNASTNQLWPTGGGQRGMWPTSFWSDVKIFHTGAGLVYGMVTQETAYLILGFTCYAAGIPLASASITA
jgi:hypothetical protein